MTTPIMPKYIDRLDEALDTYGRAVAFLERAGNAFRALKPHPAQKDFEIASAQIQSIILEEQIEARILQTKLIRDEWHKWLQFPGDKDEAKISDIVAHCNLLISELKSSLSALSGDKK